MTPFKTFQMGTSYFAAPLHNLELINPFVPNAPFLYPQKSSEIIRNHQKSSENGNVFGG